MEEKERGATYGAGVAILTISQLPSFVQEDENALKKNKNQRCPFVGCAAPNHKTMSSMMKYYHDRIIYHAIFSVVNYLIS